MHPEEWFLNMEFKAVLDAQQRNSLDLIWGLQVVNHMEMHKAAEKKQK